MFQSLLQPPKRHVIIEAHPDVLRHMRELGWYEKPGVTILEGKWQDFIMSEKVSDLGSFDAIYTDTFSEDYQGS
jgi:protein arginine N-methyltransferase 2